VIFGTGQHQVAGAERALVDGARHDRVWPTAGAKIRVESDASALATRSGHYSEQSIATGVIKQAECDPGQVYLVRLTQGCFHGHCLRKPEQLPNRGVVPPVEASSLSPDIGLDEVEAR